MSEVIRSSMSSIPADRWDLAFGRKDVKDNVQAKKAEKEVVGRKIKGHRPDGRTKLGPPPVESGMTNEC